MDLQLTAVFRKVPEGYIGCVLLREGANHTFYVNPSVKKTSSVPRHNEINNDLARKICKDLQVPQPDA